MSNSSETSDELEILIREAEEAFLEQMRLVQTLAAQGQDMTRVETQLLRLSELIDVMRACRRHLKDAEGPER